MSRELPTLRQELPVQAAVQARMQAQVGGAPMVDERGRCVGVFSMSDCSR